VHESIDELLHYRQHFLRLEATGLPAGLDA
jgi:oligoribonuclease (3'-5' exoribonuclease)